MSYQLTLACLYSQWENVTGGDVTRRCPFQFSDDERTRLMRRVNGARNTTRTWIHFDVNWAAWRMGGYQLNRSKRRWPRASKWSLNGTKENAAALTHFETALHLS